MCVCGGVDWKHQRCFVTHWNCRRYSGVLQALLNLLQCGKPFCITSKYLRVTHISPFNLYTSPEWGSNNIDTLHLWNKCVCLFVDWEKQERMIRKERETNPYWTMFFPCCHYYCPLHLQHIFNNYTCFFFQLWTLN